MSGFYWQVTVRNGRPLRSRSLWDQVLPPLAIDGADGEISRRAFNGPDGKPLVAWERATGLGLAIVADLADLYGGTLALDKGPLGGLRAVLTLPLAAPDGATARPAGNLVPIPPRH